MVDDPILGVEGDLEAALHGLGDFSDERERAIVDVAHFHWSFERGLLLRSRLEVRGRDVQLQQVHRFTPVEPTNADAEALMRELKRAVTVG